MKRLLYDSDELVIYFLFSGVDCSQLFIQLMNYGFEGRKEGELEKYAIKMIKIRSMSK